MKHRNISTPGGDGPSWLSFLEHMKDGLWSLDFFRCESATLGSHWVLLVMDQYTRRIIGFAAHAGAVDGPTLRGIFTRAIRDHPTPGFLSSDHDLLYRFRRWPANLRIRQITEAKTVPCVPLSHPFVERLIGTIRREYLDNILFWTERDLEQKSSDFAEFFNHHRVHNPLNGRPHWVASGKDAAKRIDIRIIAADLIAGACIKRPWRHDYRFAMDTLRQPAMG